MGLLKLLEVYNARRIRYAECVNRSTRCREGSMQRKKYGLLKATKLLYDEGGWAVATVSPVAALWDTSMKPAFLGSPALVRFVR